MPCIEYVGLGYGVHSTRPSNIRIKRRKECLGTANFRPILSPHSHPDETSGTGSISSIAALLMESPQGLYVWLLGRLFLATRLTYSQVVRTSAVETYRECPSKPITYQWAYLTNNYGVWHLSIAIDDRHCTKHTFPCHTTTTTMSYAVLRLINDDPTSEIGTCTRTCRLHYHHTTSKQ